MHAYIYAFLVLLGNKLSYLICIYTCMHACIHTCAHSHTYMRTQNYCI